VVRRKKPKKAQEGNMKGKFEQHMADQLREGTTRSTRLDPGVALIQTGRRAPIPKGSKSARGKQERPKDSTFREEREKKGGKCV